LAYLYVKREFPVTFLEATNPVTLPGTTFSLQPAKAYGSIPLGPQAMPLEDQAAVLLYLNISETQRRGTGISLDDVSGSAVMAITNQNGATFTVLKDAFGTQITFRRWYQDPNGELQSSPYTNTKYGMWDPFDRLGVNNVAKLSQWTTGQGPANSSTAVASLNKFFSPPLPTPVAFDGKNKVITVVSAGEDKTFGTGDDIFGYKLARFGARGD